MEELIKKEMLRLMGCVSNMDPTEKTENYVNLVHCVDLFLYMEQRAKAMRGEFDNVKVGETLQFRKFNADNIVTENTPKEAPAEIAPLIEEAALDPVTEMILEKEPPMAKPVELTMEYVRGRLSDASQNGIQIRTIIQRFVPEGKDIKFSNVPSNMYADLIKEIENAK